MKAEGPREWSPRRNLPRFIRMNKITMSSEPVPMNPYMGGDAWADEAYHYRVVLKRGPKRLMTYFSMGPAIREDPTAEEVLDSLASDASGYENNPVFEDWVKEYG